MINRAFFNHNNICGDEEKKRIGDMGTFVRARLHAVDLSVGIIALSYLLLAILMGIFQCSSCKDAPPLIYNE